MKIAKSVSFFSLMFISFGSFGSLAGFAGDKIESKRAHIECQFAATNSKDNVTPKTITIDADLSTKTAHVVSKDDNGDDNGNTEFAILTHSRASDSKDRQNLHVFSAIDGSKKYTAPSTLVIAANNGDDTDQTITIQYRPRFSSEKEKSADQTKNGDFVDVNLLYSGSCDGNMQSGQSVSCTMALE